MQLFQRKNGFEVFYELLKRIQNNEPTSLIRLGDGEGVLLGYPDHIEQSQINIVFKIWYGNTSVENEIVSHHASLIRDAVKHADIIGLPRQKQSDQHPRYAAVNKGIEHYALINDSQLFTDTAIHRYLQFALFYRALLKEQRFLGVISSRNVSEDLKRYFALDEVVYYPIRGESAFPGEQSQSHYPSRFNEIQQSLHVPFKGAVFFVGAGVLGKTYCQWIKERGGIAIDIGSIFDAWANVPSRTKHPVHKLARYDEHPTINLEQACVKYNDIISLLNLDTAPISIDSLPSDFPNAW